VGATRLFSTFFKEGLMMKYAVGAVPVMIAAGVLFIALFIWYGCRIEPEDGQVAVLIRKTGENLPPGEIIATDAKYKGIQLETIGEGRYFRNPYTWDWKIVNIIDIPAGKFGVLVRKYGKDLPEGQILAPDSSHKGVVTEVLGTGKHRVNPYAYEVRIYEDIKIMPGNVGVVGALCGADIFSGTANDFKFSNGFLVKPEVKGVQAEVLKEGTHRINPFIQSVTIVNIQSQRHEFSGTEAINFFTVDGFSVSMEGTVEFNIEQGKAARLAQEVGDMDDILNKLILPSVRGFARIEGSKKSATEFMIGESRQLFQEELENYLRHNCQKWGISINSVLIRDIIPPQAIAGIIRNREIASQEAKKFGQQIEQAKSDAELKKQQMLALQSGRTVDANTNKITAEIAAKQEQLEKTIAAKTELVVAETSIQTAQAESKSKLNIAEADRQVIDLSNRNDAQVLKQNIEAYGGGDYFIRAKLYEKLAPGIRTIMSNSAGGDRQMFGIPLLSAPVKQGGK
jgi:regulator of protease activity HflC (stomatin/prohibitin superfamily)